MAEIDYTTNGIVTVPLSPTAVSKLTGAGTDDVGAVFISGTINKWSIYKPYKSTEILSLSHDTIINDLHCGLTPVEMKTSSKDAVNYFTMYRDDADSETLPGGGEWTYDRPTSTDEPFRLSDFVSKEYAEGSGIQDYSGYNIHASAPDKGWSDKAITKANLASLTQATVSISSGSADSYDQIITATESSTSASNYGCVYETLILRIGSGSNEGFNLNGDVTNVLPITYITSMMSTGKWRLGLAVRIYNRVSGVYQWELFVSKAYLTTDYSNKSQLLPDLVTNTYALAVMLDNISNISEFTAVPLLCQNVSFMLGQQYNGGSATLARTFLTANKSALYSMPSGMATVKLKFVNSLDPETALAESFSAVAISIGQHTPEYKDILSVYIQYNGDTALIKDVEVDYTINYIYNSATNTITGTYVFEAGTVKGARSYGLVTAPGITIPTTGGWTFVCKYLN